MILFFNFIPRYLDDWQFFLVFIPWGNFSLLIRVTGFKDLPDLTSIIFSDLFFKLIFFISSFDIRLLDLKLHYFFFIFFIGLSQSHVLDFGLVELTEVDLGCLWFFFRFHLLLFNLLESWHLLFYSISFVWDYHNLMTSPWIWHVDSSQYCLFFFKIDFFSSSFSF